MKTIGLIIMLVGITATAWASAVGTAVEVRVRSDNGSELPLYPVAGKNNERRAYLEATKGEQYTIHVRNRLNRRIGVVVAVDGRNIISGQKSWLKNSERMYILEPFGEGEYSGWRANLERINRFYFTDAPDSYAAAFKDESAMGVIALAVYPELPPPVNHSENITPYLSLPAPMLEKKSMDKDSSVAARSESAGTGYGREEYAPARSVAFDPEPRPAERVFLKYEWHATLCRKGVIDCGNRSPQSRNRFWNDGFAPPPQRR
jgi:hypothetical protein